MASKTARRGSGSGGLYQDARGLWTVVVELPPLAGKRRRKVIRRRDRAAAVTELRRIRTELDRTGDLPTSSPTLDQWLTIWLSLVAAPRLKPRTLATYRSYVTRHISPAIGRYRLDKLSAAHVRRMHETIIARGCSSTTALQAHRILAKALTDAMREGRVGRNVADKDHIDAPRRAVATRTALDADQAIALLRSVADRDEGAHWATALLAGVRQGERLGITADMLDLDAGVLSVAWQLQRLTWQHGCVGHRCGRERAGYCPERTVMIPPDQEVRRVYGGLWLTRPKSRAGWRQVPLAPELWEILRRYRATHDLGDEGLIFHRDDGHPIDPRADSTAWDAALRAAGLPDVVLHSARHTTASLLYVLKVPEQTRMAILGHSSATVTAGYTHVTDREARDAMGLLGAMLYPQIEG